MSVLMLLVPLFAVILFYFCWIFRVGLLSALISDQNERPNERMIRANFHRLIDKMSINFNMTLPLYPDRFLLCFVFCSFSLPFQFVAVVVTLFIRTFWLAFAISLLPLKFELAFAVNVQIHHIYGLRVSKSDERRASDSGKKKKKPKWAEQEKKLNTDTHATK